MVQRRLRKKKITIEVKKEIKEKYEKGVRPVDLCVDYDMSKSTIGTTLKKTDFNKGWDVVANGVSSLSSCGNEKTEEMETLLLDWINEKQLKRDSASQSLICETA